MKPASAIVPGQRSMNDGIPAVAAARFEVTLSMGPEYLRCPATRTLRAGRDASFRRAARHADGTVQGFYQTLDLHELVARPLGRVAVERSSSTLVYVC